MKKICLSASSATNTSRLNRRIFQDTWKLPIQKLEYDKPCLATKFRIATYMTDRRHDRHEAYQPAGFA
jgi:hypothetical protein